MLKFPPLAIGSSLRWTLNTFNMLPYRYISFPLVPLFGTARCSRLICMPCSSPRVCWYSRSPGFYYWRPVLETKVWVLVPIFFVSPTPHSTNADDHLPMCSCLYNTLSPLTLKSTGAYQQHFLLECSSLPSSGWNSAPSRRPDSKCRLFHDAFPNLQLDSPQPFIVPGCELPKGGAVMYLHPYP